MLGMQLRVLREKLLLILTIKKEGEDYLAREVLTEQVDLGLPSPVREATKICEILCLPDVCVRRRSVKRKSSTAPPDDT